MRVLWLSPWMRPLARVQAQALMRRGHDVLLVTSDQHPEPAAARAYELVLNPRLKTLGSWPALAPARARVTAFAPDVVVAELVRDPRWIALAGRRPRVSVVHDDRPHDAGEQRPQWERSLFDRWAAGAARTVAFSRYVAGEVAPGAALVPLTSDLDESLVPAVVDAAGRRDFVAVGRLRPYKNLAVTLDAWRAHTAGAGWRDDELVLLGDGDVPPLPPHTRHIGGPYRYVDALPILARAKGSLVNYRQASQSGVQVLAMQLGVVPLVSPEGALPDYQPPGEAPVGVDDIAGLTAAFDALADPAAAAARGAAARAHYARGMHADVAAATWETVLSDVLQRAASTR